jgi:hypothetical protein
MSFVNDSNREEIANLFKKLGVEKAKRLIKERVEASLNDLRPPEVIEFESEEELLLKLVESARKGIGDLVEREVRNMVEEEREKTAGKGKKTGKNSAVEQARKLLRQKVSHACVADLTNLSLDEIKRIAAAL